MTTLKFIILLRFLHIVLVHGKDEMVYYEENALECHYTLVYFTKASATKCAMMCNQHSQLTNTLCLGFGAEDNSCKLCMACQQTSQRVTLTTGQLFQAYRDDFMQSLTAALSVHIHMSTIYSNGMVKVKMGTFASVHGNPPPYQMGPGKYGRCIHIPNVGPDDGIHINLYDHSNDCFGKVTLCPKGVTFSIWFKAPAQTHDSLCMFSSPMMRIFFNRMLDGQLQPRYILNDTSYLALGNPVTLDEWHHIGIVYYNTEWAVYRDGCKESLGTGDTAGAPAGNQVGIIHIGCEGGSNCMNVYVDTIRFYNEMKNGHFMWMMWQCNDIILCG